MRAVLKRIRLLQEYAYYKKFPAYIQARKSYASSTGSMM